MTMENTQQYKQCVYYCYCQYCKKPYLAEKAKYGYSDLTDYPCKKVVCKDFIPRKFDNEK